MKTKTNEGAGATMGNAGGRMRGRQRWEILCLAVSAALPICATNATAQVPEKIIHAFTGYPVDGQAPSSLVPGGRGVLYGSTKFGGNAGNGTVFSMIPPASPDGAWTEGVIYNLPAATNNPYPYVAAVENGVVLGFTRQGGSGLQGNVFTLTPPASPGSAWNETDIYDFPNLGERGGPNALIVANGVIYGTTDGDALFSLTPPASAGGAWTEKMLYGFSGGSDGGAPNSLMMGAGGVLYGTAQSGGISNNGIVFSLIPPAERGGVWTEKVLYSFNGGSDGSGPVGLAMGSGGVLYGTTFNGGITTPECGVGCGTVFSLTPPASAGGAWTEAVLYRFNGTSDGYAPPAGVTIGSDGVLYGVTGNANENDGGGVAFSLAPPSAPGGVWTETVLHSFTGTHGMAGVDPSTRLVPGPGVLYGATYSGGGHEDGTVFQLKP
jgi:hypothetical protein